MELLEDRFRENDFRPVQINGELVYRFYHLFVPDQSHIHLSFLASRSSIREGMSVYIPDGELIQTDRNNSQGYDNMVFLLDSYQPVAEFQVFNTETRGEDVEVVINNAWQKPDGSIRESYRNAGMKVHDENGKLIFYCNNGQKGSQLTFDDIVIRLEVFPKNVI